MTLLAEAGWTTKVVEIGRDQTKWEPALVDLSDSGEWDLIITSGSNAIETVQTVADECPAAPLTVTTQTPLSEVIDDEKDI